MNKCKHKWRRIRESPHKKCIYCGEIKLGLWDFDMFKTKKESE